MSYNFKQYDTRWGNKAYSGSTMSACGCGPTAVADIVYNLDNTITPYKVAKWLTKNGWAGTKGGGTIHAGITAALKHYGFNTKGCTNASGAGDVSMPDFFKAMAKDNCWGVILFSAGTLGGVTWTASGHYMVVNDYKVSGGKHYFYMLDPGQRNHNGWYCYESTMKGLCFRAYTASLSNPPAKEKTTYSGNFPVLKVTRKSNAECINNMVDFALSISKKGFAYRKFTSDLKTHKCPICHPEVLGKTKGDWKNWSKGTKMHNCIGLVSAILFHGGKIKTVKCANNGIGNNAFFDDLTLAKWKKKNGSDWKEVKKRQKGCVIICFNKKTGKYVHTAFDVGGGYIVDSTSSKGEAKRKLSNLNKYKNRYFVYTGQMKTITEVKQLAKGDSRAAQIKKLQAFLNWYGNYGLSVDGDFGTSTEKAVKKFQKNEGLTADGMFGSKSLAKAKEVKR